MSKLKVVLATALLSVSLGALSAQQTDTTKPPDNTKQNEGAEHSTATADRAKNNKSDLQLMKQIRRSVIKDKNLSTDAHNVKIVAQGGKVTLSGVVKSDDEKKAVEQKATEVAGADNVTSQITVK